MLLFTLAYGLLLPSAPSRSRTPLLCDGESVKRVYAPLVSPAWPAVRDELNRLPVFAVANEKGEPLQYDVAGKPQAIFYADVGAAAKEMAAAQAQNPDLTIDLIPVGLGSVFKLTYEDRATLVPGTAELVAAGAPEGVQPLGQQLPLFACLEMTREAEGGDGEVLPLFMSHADCTAAVRQATADSLEEGDDPLEIVGLSLPSVVERLTLSGMDKDNVPAFMFIPPKTSASFVEKEAAKAVPGEEDAAESA